MTKATPFRLSILGGLLLTLAAAPAAGQTGMTAHRDIDYVDGVDYADGSGLASELRAQGDFLSVAACEVRPEARKPVTHVHGP